MRGIRTIGALSLAAALLLSACGDDDDDDADAGAAPTGAPIDIGFINVENSPGGSFPDLRMGAEAAVEYINKERGGINGRPLNLEVCISNGSGESSIACANKFVQEGKVAVSYGYDHGGASSAPVLADGGVPVIGGFATDSAQLRAPNAFLFAGGITGAVPALCRYIGEDIKPRKMAVLSIDIPQTRLAIDTFCRPVAAKFGVTDLTTVFEAATAPDWTPALAKANEGEPDVVLTLVSGQACAKIMQASQNVGIPTSKLIYLQGCTGSATLEAGGPGANGVLVQSPYVSPTSEDEQVKIYRDALEEYQPDASIGTESQGTFGFIMNMADIMGSIQGDITRESLLTAMRQTVNQPNYMSHPYTCDGKQVPNLPAVCNTYERLFKIENGDFVDVTTDWVEGASLLGQ